MTDESSAVVAAGLEARVELLELRILDLLEYNNREVERRRAAIAALRTVLVRIEGTVATMWHARKEDGSECQYLGTLVEFLRASIAEGSR